jgi:TolB-like protein/DNA-binding winged helix-turn-helix (wHTH) protein/tetratricopeptide (TPR) repeat protein
MGQAHSELRVLKFGVFEVDLETGELRKSGMLLKLVGQPFQVLQVLLEHPQEIVTREELRRCLWPEDTFVDYDLALKRIINRLREVLGDSAESPRFIETIPRRGYRFIAPLHANGDARAVAELPTEAVPAETRRFRRNLQIGIVLGLGGTVLLLVLLGFLPTKLWWRRSVTSGAPQIRSLAVLPLQSLSADPAQEYFADGMTDALITDLAQNGSLKVISRTSSAQYKGTKESLPEIARELNVDGIIEGTVQRSGDRVRITAQLIYGPSDKHLWANSYERDVRDVFALERDVADDVSRQVKAQVAAANPVAAKQSRPVNPKALDAYLQGNYHQNRYGRGGGNDESKKAREYFQQAIDADPNFAAAYDGLAEAHLGLLWPSTQDVEIATKAAERAVALEPNSSDAHVTLGEVEFGPWNWAGAEEELRRAIALNPNNARAHEYLGWLLDDTGRLDEGWREYQIAQELDPNNDHLSDALGRRGQYDRAITILQMMLKRYPDDGILHVSLYKIYLNKGMHKEAIEELEKTYIAFGSPDLAARIHHAFLASGYRGALRQYAQELEYLAATKQMFIPVNVAEVYATLGDKDRAFYWLEQAYSHRDILPASTDTPVGDLRFSFLLNPIQSDPRFTDLVRRVGQLR